MGYKKGDRVGAIFGSGERGPIEFFGYGVYEGDFVPKEAAGQIAEVMTKTNFPNPRIRLDSGKVVYGCECWWGLEENIRGMLSETCLMVKEVDIDEVREATAKAQKAEQHADCRKTRKGRRDK
jgi:hypothetical protein